MPSRDTPAQIGPYRVIGVIGEGGMGRVYEVEHTLIGRRAAVKVLGRDFATKPDIVQRFLNEARAANRIEHPGIVQIYEFGAMPDGAPYFVMELLKGHSLARVLRLRPAIVEPEARALGRMLARILVAVHGAGIVHRDLKPDNVFLVRSAERPDEWTVKILDFGIAKLQEHDGGGGTSTDSWMGTPSYMSPEQLQGAKGVDARADIYSLGVILYRMLAGRVPFEADNYGALIVQSVTAPAPPLRAAAPGASAEIESVVRRAMAKRPQRRFQTMEELALALGGRAHVDEATGSLRLPWLDEALSRPDALAPAAPPVAPLVVVPAAPPLALATRDVATVEATTMSRSATETMHKSRARTYWASGLAGVLALAVTATAIGWWIGKGAERSETEADSEEPSERPRPAPRDVRGEAPGGAARAPAPAAAGTTGAPAARSGEPFHSPAGGTLPAGPSPSVTVTLATVPSGADVYDAVTHERLGSTPHALAIRLDDPARRLSLRLSGHEPSDVTVSAFGGARIETFPLHAVGRPAPGKPATTPAPAKTRKRDIKPVW